MRTVLVSGFEPFGGENVNPSREVALALDGREIAGLRIASVVLPVQWRAGPERLLHELASRDPDALIMLG